MATIAVASVALAPAGLAVATPQQSAEARLGVARPAADVSGDVLTTASSKTLFFGHQSVGGNILKGVGLLYKQNGIAKPLVVEWTTGGAPTGTAIVHSYVGRNRDPRSKIAQFKARLDAMQSDPDAALLKFCYVDITAKTNVTSLFATYRKAMARLKAAHPTTVILHATVPLTAKDPASNVKRHQYNKLIRETYSKRRIVDVARAESTTPQGKRVTGTYKGKRYYAMHPDYSTDGGHLNEVGARVVAAELLKAVAAS